MLGEIKLDLPDGKSIQSYFLLLFVENADGLDSRPTAMGEGRVGSGGAVYGEA